LKNNKKLFTMKVVLPKGKEQHGKPNKPPILPLVLNPEDDKPLKENLQTFELYSVPGDNTSVKYKITIRRLVGDESLRTAIAWCKDLTKLHTGLNLDARPVDKIRITMQILKDQALSAFCTGIDTGATIEREAAANAAYNAEADNTRKQAAYDAEMNKALTAFHNDNALTTGINGMIKFYAPKKALQRVKRYLRREQRKPAGMKVRQYLQNLLRINFEEVPFLPPFKGDTQCLTDDELVEIITFAVPKSWNREMDRQGKDPVDMTSWEVVEFLEQIEASEDFDNDNNTKKQAKKSKKDPKGKGNGGGKYCTIHGNGNHTTDECRTIKSQIEKAKNGGKSANKTWNRKADDAKKAAKKELAAFVKKKVQEEMNAAEDDAKKRKAEDESSTDEEMNAIEERVSDIDLQEFNYENLDVDKIST
jgi:hypothetical protein